MDGPLRVPGYAAGRQLGSAHSSTWLGVEETTGEPVTLRLVRGDPAVVNEGLSTAALVLRAVQHPHVIPFHGVVDSPAGPVLVLGAAEGGSLADALKVRRVLPPGEMVTACAPIAEALAEIHQHGIVHGAITPDDILFARDGRPMLAGVGLAAIGARLNTHGPTIAPEVAANGSYSAAADVYSIAAVGLTTLTGPVAADQLFAASAEHLLATGMAPAAQAVITRAVGRNVSRRPDAESLFNALYQVADPEPVELALPDADEQPAGGLGASTLPPGGGSPAGPVTPPASGGPSADFDPAAGADELDDVTAYMRRGTGAGAGRRARRSGRAGSSDRASGDPASGVDRTSAGAGAGPLAPGVEPAASASGVSTDRPAGVPPVGGLHGGTEAPGGGNAAARRPSDLSKATVSGRKRSRGSGSPGGPAADEDAPAVAGTAASAAPSAPTEGTGRRRGRGRSNARSADEGGTSVRSGRTSGRPGGSGGDDPPRTSDAGHGGSGRRSGRTRKTEATWLVSGLVVVLLVVGAVIFILQLQGGDDELPEAGLGNPESVDEGQSDLCGGPRPAPEEEPAEVTDWTQEVQRLYTLRAQAFEEIDADLLCQVYAPTSEGLVRDVELLQEYAENEVRTQDLSFEVINADLVEQNGGTVVLEIADRLPPYQLVDTDGDVVETKEGIDHGTWTAELVPIADEPDQTPTWRFG